MRVGLPSVPRVLYPKSTSHIGQWVESLPPELNVPVRFAAFIRHLD